MTERSRLVTTFKRALDNLVAAAQATDDDATDRARADVEAAFFQALGYREMN